MKNTWMNLLAGATLAGATLVGGQASADYNKLLDTLQKKGALTAEEAAGLKAKSLAPANKWVDSLRFRGRVHMQAAYVDAENDVNSGDWSTMELRRARFGVRGEFPGKFRAEVEGNILPEEANLRAAYIQWRAHKPAYVKVGYDKPLSSLEENTSSAEILTVERSNINNTVAAPGETVGIVLEGEMAPLFYAVGLYNDEMSVRNTSQTEAEYLFNAQGGVNLELSEGSSLMAMATYMASDDPNGNVGAKFADVTVFSLHFTAGAFDLRTEFMMGSNDDKGDTDGFYIMPSMMMTDKLQAVFRYEQAESDNATGLRATSRYGQRTDVVVTGTDADGKNVVADKGDEFSAIYLGVNYYISGHGNKLMFGVEFNELDNTKAGKLDSTTVFSAWRVLF